jgi:hypothetical protein
MAACGCDGDNDRQDQREGDALVANCTALAELLV